MNLHQLLVKGRLAWRQQQQQIRVIGGALLVLLCIVFWERSQWTQPIRSDLLHDLPQVLSVHSSETFSATSLPHTNKADPAADWSCQTSAAWFHKQPHKWHELEDLAGLLCNSDVLAHDPVHGLTRGGMQCLLF